MSETDKLDPATVAQTSERPGSPDIQDLGGRGVGTVGSVTPERNYQTFISDEEIAALEAVAEAARLVWLPRGVTTDEIEAMRAALVRLEEVRG